MTPRPTPLLALVTAVLLVLAGCTVPTPGSTSSSSTMTAGGGAPDGPNVLRVLAGSELADPAPILDQARSEIGVDVRLDEAGTLDASADIASGKAGQTHDASWLSSNRYLALLEGGEQQVAVSTKIMASPVLLGVRTEAAKRLGWDAKAPTWSQIAAAGAAKKFRYAMTNPTASNTGFSTLVAVATSVTGGGAALNEAKAKAAGPQLTGFFTGQALTAGSTGWITDKFVADAGVDGLFSYESTLLQLAASGRVPGGLTLVTPSDGVITGDYPLSLLASASDAKRASYTKLVDWLRTPAVQTRIMELTSRRPSAGGVKPDARFDGRTTLIDLPFPSSRTAVDALLAGYLDVAKRPARTVYVLDVSGSMAGQRIAALKQAMGALTAADSGGSTFTRFHAREDVTLLPFSDRVQPAQRFVVPADDPTATLGQIRTSVDGLAAGGSTAMWEALRSGVEAVNAQRDATAYPTVVLLTDGEANGKMTRQQFEAFYGALPAAQRVPVFTIRFGDARTADLEAIATLTGGKAFDGTGDLAEAFRTIRGYQ